MMQGDDIRRLARAARLAACANVGADASTATILTEALLMRGLGIENAQPGEFDPETLARLSRIESKIIIAPGLNAHVRHFVIAHEIGHADLHDQTFEMRAIRYFVGDETHFDTGYSQRSLVEMQADVFAAEFLCPGDMLCREIIGCGRKPSRIAARLDVELELVLAQAVGATLLPEICNLADGGFTSLDEVQATAVAASGNCVFVRGDPGTGKTSAVAGRAATLLNVGTSPATIAVLAHSEPAAERLRVRIAASHPDAAARLWIGTPTTFGLEIVSCHAERAGLGADFGMLDTTGAVALLERRAADLPPDAAGSLRAALAAIAAGRRTGRDTSTRLRKPALTPDVLAAIATVYEEAKRKEGRLDSADVLDRAVGILRSHPAVARRYRRRFAHLLVDDLQDLSRSGLALLSILGAQGCTIFAAGNARQAIRRFHGAAPDEMDPFLQTARAVRFELPTDHRSMAATTVFASSSGGGVVVAPDRRRSHAPGQDAGLASLCRRIRELAASGTALRDQAVLTRTHGRSKAVARALAAAGIAASHLGEIAEREEVLDLVAVANLDDMATGAAALRRLGRLRTYRCGESEIRALAARAERDGVTVMAVLTAEARRPGAAKNARRGAASLGLELAGLRDLQSTWLLVATWLFERSRYLDVLTAGNDPDGPLKRLAAFHVLSVLREQDALGERGGVRALERLRRLGSIDQHTAFSKVAVDACDIDAVRLMTIHASQGREFEAVHVMVDGRAAGHAGTTRSGRDEVTEDAVRVVAFSRARRYLHLQRTDQRGDLEIDPSLLVAAMPASGDGVVGFFEARARVDAAVHPTAPCRKPGRQRRRG